MAGDDPLIAVSDGKDGIYIAIHAQPGARRAQLRGLHGEAIKIAISEAAQEGKANRAILDVVAKGLGVTRNDVELASGQTSRQKRVRVHGDPLILKQSLVQWFKGCQRR